jgi:hypothetical protein
MQRMTALHSTTLMGHHDLLSKRGVGLGGGARRVKMNIYMLAIQLSSLSFPAALRNHAELAGSLPLIGHHGLLSKRGIGWGARRVKMNIYLLATQLAALSLSPHFLH